MKKRWLKRIFALGLTALMSMSSLTAFANQTDPTDPPKVTITIVDDNYYRKLLYPDLPDEEIQEKTDTATIKVEKKTTVDKNVDDEQTSFEQKSKPINGVVFGIAKVGDFVQVTEKTAGGIDSYMAYAIKETIIDKVIGEIQKEEPGFTWESDIEFVDPESGVKYCGFKDYEEINGKLKRVSSDSLTEIFEDTEKFTTGEEIEENKKDGLISLSKKEFGLYLIAELDVSKAETQTKVVVDNEGNETGEMAWEPMTITEKQYPYVVSAPIYTPKTDANPNGKWDADVNARAKNSTGTTESEKKIVKGADDLNDVDGSMLVDNDNTHIGDTVVFKLTNGVVTIKEGEINSYIIQDSLSKGFTFTDENGDVIPGNIEIKDSNNPVVKYEDENDYTVTIVNESDIEENKDLDGLSWDGRYPDGTNIKIEFTKDGLRKLTELSKNKDISKKELYVCYTAVVNKDAIVVDKADTEGTSGNPNQSRLIFRANNSNTITTGWDEVREYIFTMDGHKTFDGVPSTVNAQFVTFELFTKENNDFVPANVTEETVEGTTDSIPGTYVYGGKSNIVKLDTENGEFSIKGVPTGVTLYLKETETADGFNLLKEPIEIELTAVDNTTGESDSKTNWGTLKEGTVNGKDALNSATNATGVTFTIDNTSGFQLPSTGGMGSTIFAIVGMLIIAAGGVFFLATSKRKR